MRVQARLWIVAVVAVILVFVNGWSAVAQELPNHHHLVAQIAQRHPELLSGINEEARRTWTQRVAETLAAWFPAEPWGASGRVRRGRSRRT